MGGFWSSRPGVRPETLHFQRALWKYWCCWSMDHTSKSKAIYTWGNWGSSPNPPNGAFYKRWTLSSSLHLHIREDLGDLRCPRHVRLAITPVCFPFSAGLQNMILFNKMDILMYFSVSDSRGQFLLVYPRLHRWKQSQFCLCQKHLCLLLGCITTNFFTFAFKPFLFQQLRSDTDDETANSHELWYWVCLRPNEMGSRYTFSHLHCISHSNWLPRPDSQARGNQEVREVMWPGWPDKPEF